MSFKSNLRIIKVYVELAVPYHVNWCERKDRCEPSCGLGTAEFRVDLRTGECHGRMKNGGGSTTVNETFWKWLCDRVNEEVRAQLKDHVVFEPVKKIVMDLRPGIGEWSD